MAVIKRLRGIKFNLSRMTTDELVTVLDNMQRQRQEIGTLMDAVDQELMHRTMLQLEL